MGTSNNTDTKSRAKFYCVIALILIAVIAIILAVINWKTNKSLKDQLTEAEREKALLEIALADSEEHDQEQTSIIAGLQEQIDSFLNIEETEPVITTAQLKEQLSAISELVTQQYIYTNASSWEQSKDWILGWSMPFSEKSLVVRYDGTIKAGINLNDVTINVNEDSRTITVILPKSEITDNYIPQETIEVLDQKDGLFNKVSFDNYNDLISAGKEEMKEKAIERGMLTNADREAEAIIRAFLNLIPGIDTYELNITTR